MDLNLILHDIKYEYQLHQLLSVIKFLVKMVTTFYAFTMDMT